LLAATAPLSVYGASKLAGEAAALAHDDALVVRTSWLFGPGGPNFAATMHRLMTAGERRLRVVDDQVGCPTYTPFLARALVELAELGARGVVHYRNREPVSWHGFASEIARHLDPQIEVAPVPTSEFPRPARRPAYSVLAVDRFERWVGRRVEAWGWALTEYLETLRRASARPR
jgi:dTDP-4-dehydrorhamnose reductase